MKKFLAYTALGILGGWAVIGMATAALMSMHMLMTVGVLPSDLTSSMFLGGIIGALVGLYKAGLRLHWE